MTRRYFGTDGIARRDSLTPDLVERLGRAATIWVGGGRVLVGRDTRGSGRRARGSARTRDHVGGRRRGPRRSAAHACGCPLRARSRRRRVRVAQPARVQRRQALRPRRRKAHRRGRGGNRELPRRAADRDRDRSSGTTTRPTRYLEHVARALRHRPRRPADRGRLRKRRVLRDRARRLRAARRRRHGVGAGAGRDEHQPGCGATDLALPAADRFASSGLDLGVAFDGDGDRMLAVDAQGEPSTATRSSRCSPSISASTSSPSPR